MHKSWLQPSLARDVPLLAGLVLAVLVFFLLWFSYQTFERFERRIQGQLTHEAEKIDATLTDAMEHAEFTLKGIGQLLVQTRANDLYAVERLLRSFDNAPDLFVLFSWINTDNQLIVTSNEGRLQSPLDVSARDYQQKAVAEPWVLHPGNPRQGSVSNRWIVPAAMGLTNDAGEYIGTVLISIDISGMTEAIRSVINNAGVYFSVVLPDPYTEQMIVLSQVPWNSQFSKEYFSYEPKQNVIRPKPRHKSQGTLFSAMVKSSQDYPYQILIAYDADTANHEIFSRIMPRILQFIVMGLLMITLLFMVRRTVIAPTLELTNIAQKLSRGETDVTLPTTGALEIDLLTQQLSRIRDFISERRTLENELRHKAETLAQAKQTSDLAHATKTEHLTTISHELRTPLNTIIGFSEMIKEDILGPIENEHYRQYAHDIHASGQQLLELMNDIFDLSQLEIGVVTLRRKPLIVRDLIEKCLRLLSNRTKEGDIRFRNTTPASLPRLIADELRLKQILINLLTNAIKYSPPGETITIHAEVMETEDENHREFVIRIEDNGVGMLEEDIPLATSRFARMTGNASSQREAGGGLGLPLSCELMKLHNGRLDIDSAPGRGTTVSLVFPEDAIAGDGASL